MMKTLINLLVPIQRRLSRIVRTRRYEGKQEKQITVYSNDPENPEIVLT